jgi:leucyl-tRNA synthetase
MRGKNVLHPMGWDAFGLPAENAAIENKVHPAKWTRQNIDYMRGQLKRMGYSYDWRREFATCDPEYYRWEQLIFVKMMEKGLVYKAKSFVNWCDQCKTVLANEQVEAGYCWRHSDTPVRQKELAQWFFKITHYADELLDWTEKLPGWPDKVLTMQQNWIGKSLGAYIHFPLEKSYSDPDSKQPLGHIRVYTTRQDTVYGATFMSLAAEHPLAELLSRGTAQEPAVREFCDRVRREEKIKRSAKDYKKEGVFTGAYCRNPMTGARMPVYVANFVLMDYGTGAVMAVPAHDQRDFDFAKVYNLPIIPVVQPPKLPLLAAATMTEAYADEGTMINSGESNGLPSEEFRGRIAERLEREKRGGPAVNYRMRDWLISRQRYWGAPIPVIYCEQCGTVAVPEKDLPVVLPTEVQIDFSVGSPLAQVESWVKARCPRCGGPARRETDTMDTFVESSWYFERFCSPRSATGPFDAREVGYWMPVDQYIGGVEHAVLHLLYARFWTKVLRDLGYVKFDEPFTRLLTQGMVIKESFACPGHGVLKPEQITPANTCASCGSPVVERVEEGKPTLRVCKGHGYFFPAEVTEGKCLKCGLPISTGRKEKMSKSKRNVVDPAELVERLGADTVRLFLLFAAPPDKEIDWSDEGVQGAYRFVNRIWTLIYQNLDQLKGIGPADAKRHDYLSGPADEAALYAKVHWAIAEVTKRIDRFNFNTAISALMELYNLVSDFNPGADGDLPRRRALLRFALETMVTLLNPFTPHLCEELWREFGHADSTFRLAWPQADPRALKSEEFELVIQVNGKVRGKAMVSSEASEDELKSLALSHERVRPYTEGKTVKKIIVVPKKLVNVVV